LIHNRLSLTLETYLKFGTLAALTDKQPGIPGTQQSLGADVGITAPLRSAATPKRLKADVRRTIITLDG
jgi:hypothetical protein